MKHETLNYEAMKEFFQSVPFVDEVEEFNIQMGKSWQNRNVPTINKSDADFVINFIQEELNELRRINR